MAIYQEHLLVMTSDKSDWVLDGFFWLLDKYLVPRPNVTVAGYRYPPGKLIPEYARLLTIGNFEDYPANRWSDSFIYVLSSYLAMGVRHAWIMLDDYWLVRQVDHIALRLLFEYMRAHPNVLKVDLSTDRLYAHRGEPFLYGKNTHDRVGYLDLIKSEPDWPYHMSLWGGLWNIENLLSVIVPGETAQDIEIRGTERLKSRQDLLVLGTRQAPVVHTNILRGGLSGPEYRGYEVDGQWVNGIESGVMDEMMLARVEIR